MFNPKGRHKTLAFAVHVLKNTYDFVISRFCFAEDGKEMCKDSKSRRTIVLLIKPFDWWRSRSRHRRVLLKHSVILQVKNMFFLDHSSCPGCIGQFYPAINSPVNFSKLPLCNSVCCVLSRASKFLYMSSEGLSKNIAFHTTLITLMCDQTISITYLISRQKHSTRSRLFRGDSDFLEKGAFFVSAHRV